MSKNGSKSKKNRTQKLIIPKGTLDNNDTTVIEIPSQYRSQEIVIAKKSNISSYSSKIDQSINTYSSDRGYHQSIAPCGRQMETASQTPYDESDIEKLMEDLEAYYHAQKNFLIKSSTLLRKQMDECQNQKTPSMCSCNQQNSTTTSYTPAVFLMKKVCSQENISSCSFEGQCRKKEAQPCTRSWGRNESPRMNMSGSYYNPDLSMSRNITQYSNNSNNPQSFVNKSTSGQTNDSFWPRNENSPFESTAISDPHYDLFREGISRNADVSRRNYKPLLNSKALFAQKAEELRLQLKDLNRNNLSQYYDDLLNSQHLFARKAESLRRILKQFDKNPSCIICNSQEIMNTMYCK